MTARVLQFPTAEFHGAVRFQQDLNTHSTVCTSACQSATQKRILEDWEESRLLGMWVGEPRLLSLYPCYVAHPDQDPNGLLVFSSATWPHSGRRVIDPPLCEYRYERIPAPTWWVRRDSPSNLDNWFLFRLGPFTHGPSVTLPARQYSLARRPLLHCPTCHEHDILLFDEETGGLFCRNCSGDGQYRRIEHERVVVHAAPTPGRKRPHLEGK